MRIIPLKKVINNYFANVSLRKLMSLRNCAYLFQSESLLKKYSAEISISRCLCKENIHPLTRHERIRPLSKGKRGDERRRRKRILRKSCGCLSSAYPVARKMPRSASFFLLYAQQAVTRKCKFQHLFGLPEMHHDGRMRVPTMEIVNL